MAKPEAFEMEKLIVSVIYHDREVLEKTLEILKADFGGFDFISEEFSFSEGYSSYYDDELGGEGFRKIYSFERLVNPEFQADIKIRTNEIEDSFNRRINLDPGLMSDGRLLLPTTKRVGFRIPLKAGIYCDYALFYARGEWHKFPWTYRDYQNEEVQKFLLKVRKKYLAQRKAPVQLDKD